MSPKALLLALFLPPFTSHALTLQWNANPASEQIAYYEVCSFQSNQSAYSIVNVGNTTSSYIYPVSNALTTYWVRAAKTYVENNQTLVVLGFWSDSITYDPNVPIPFAKVSNYSFVKNNSTGVMSTTLGITGTPNFAFSVQSSENLLTWLTVFTGQVAANGTYSFQTTSTKQKLFYRVAYN